MTDINELLARLEAEVATAATNYGSASAISDVFEGYVWSVVLAAARSEGATIEFENVHEQSTQQLVFRTSPGFIYSKNADYSHTVIRFCNRVTAYLFRTRQDKRIGMLSPDSRIYRI